MSKLKLHTSGIFVILFAAAALRVPTLMGAPAPFQNKPASAASASNSRSLLSSVDETLAEMSRITGLPIKAPLEKRIVTRPEIEKFLREDLHAEYTADEIHAQEALLKAFGLVSPEFDLEEFTINFYTE